MQAQWYVIRGLSTPRRQGYARTPLRYGTQGVGDYVSVIEASNRLRITRQGVRARIRRGQLPAIKIADMWLIKLTDLPTQRWSV